VTDRDPIEISERELVAMTGELDDMHHDALPKMYESVAEWAELGKARVGQTRASRRGFLTGSGLALGGVILAACGSSKKSTSTTAAVRQRHHDDGREHRPPDRRAGDVARELAVAPTRAVSTLRLRGISVRCLPRS